jgi:glycosyltransferase involved in cell wall biosynthesis
MKCIPNTVSVVIPLYNHERYIDAALESVLCQSLPAFEIIVVDDGSTDDSYARVERIAASHQSRFVYWTQPNQGAHAALNAGIHRASGEFIAILNSDDAWHPDRLRCCLSEIGQSAAIATGIEFFDESGRSIEDPWYQGAKAFAASCDDLALALVNGNFIMTTSNLVVRREVILHLGGFAALRYAHDLDFFLRLLVTGSGLKVLDQPLLSYRRHGANTISEDVLSMKTEWAMVTALFLQRRMQRAHDDWGWYGRFSEITERHGLTRILVPALAFLAALPSDEQNGDALSKNPEFANYLRSFTQ